MAVLGMGWHAGEAKMHSLLRVPELDNPTMPMLTPQAARMLAIAPLIAIGTLDADGNPWTTLWGGQTPLSQPLGQSMIGIRTPVDAKNDPVVKLLFAGDDEKTEGDVAKGGQSKMVAALTIDLETRKRVKMYGRLVASGLTSSRRSMSVPSTQKAPGSAAERDPVHDEDVKEAQLVLRIDQSLGNCPKYLNSKAIKSASTSESRMLFEGPALSAEARDVVNKADLFFVSSTHSGHDMDTNHRGGPPGFVRISHFPGQNTTLVWPEYSGNRFYQTLGNLQQTPRAGLVFPDFDSGSVLYLTGTTEILVGQDAAAVLPHTNLAVRVTVTSSILVAKGLPFRGVSGEQSPYNPRVRLLASEDSSSVHLSQPFQHAEATLTGVESITPSIKRHTFTVSDGNLISKWQPGGWAAFDFSEELDVGYSHMRDDDPRSLNDDFIRTFTVSRLSPSDRQFDLIVRNVGIATAFLARQSPRSGLTLPLKGAGEGLSLLESLHVSADSLVGFVAGGVGITPLLSQLDRLPSAEIERLRVLWTLHASDFGLVKHLLQRCPSLGPHLEIFLTGSASVVDVGDGAAPDRKSDGIEGVQVHKRRLAKDDLQRQQVPQRWHVCVSSGLRKVLLGWLEGKTVLYEDFNY